MKRGGIIAFKRLLPAAVLLMMSFTASAVRDPGDLDAEYPARSQTVETDNAIAGTKVFAFQGGTITVSESQNKATIQTTKYGTFSFNLDDEALTISNGNISAATALRAELREALIRDRGYEESV